MSAPNGENAGGESAVGRKPMVRCSVTVLSDEMSRHWQIQGKSAMQMPKLPSAMKVIEKCSDREPFIDE